MSFAPTYQMPYEQFENKLEALKESGVSLVEIHVTDAIKAVLRDMIKARIKYLMEDWRCNTESDRIIELARLYKGTHGAKKMYINQYKDCVYLTSRESIFSEENPCAFLVYDHWFSPQTASKDVPKECFWNQRTTDI